jgi:hypothetical protein
MNKETRAKFEVPLWERYSLTINEASCYLHIGDRKLREIIEDDPNAPYLIRVGQRLMIKRKHFEQFLDGQAAV